MTVLEWLESIRPAIPMSQERPCTIATKSEVRRWCEQGAVLLNGERANWRDSAPEAVTGLVFFPKSRRRTTVV